MCLFLDVSTECFCDSRVVEILTRCNNIKSNSNICKCDKVMLRSFNFSLCDACHKKIIHIRQKLKKILLSFQRKTFFDVSYHNSVFMYVQRLEEINFWNPLLPNFTMLVVGSRRGRRVDKVSSWLWVKRRLRTCVSENNEQSRGLKIKVDFV